MLEDELRGRTVVLERTLSISGYDVRGVDSSGAGLGEPIATVKGVTRIAGSWGFSVHDGQRLVLDVARKAPSLSLTPLYFVVDEANNVLGTFEHGKLGVRHWEITDNDGYDLGSIERRSPPILFLRWLLNRWFLEAIPLPFGYALVAGGVEVGSFRRKPQLRRRYLLDLSQDAEGRLNPLLALGIAIVLAEMEEHD